MWKVTHIDGQGRKHQLMVAAPSSAVAEAWAVQLWGLPLVMVLIRQPAPVAAP